MASFTIDPVNRLIILDQIVPDGNGFVVIDVQIDLYSEMKLFWKDNVLAHGLIFPWTAVGGTPYGGGRFQGTDYFLRNDLGWRIRPYEADHELQIIGNLRPTLITEATIIPTIGDYVVYAPQERSGVFQVVETGVSGVSEQDKDDIADKSAVTVWAYSNRVLTSFGTLVSDIWSWATRLLTGSGLTAPEQAELTGIKERTDNLPDAPADVSDIPTAEENRDATWNKVLP